MGAQKCVGKKIHSGEPCGMYAIAGRDRCRFHSGGYAQGQLAVDANDKTKFLKNLPPQMRPAFLQSLRDPNQTSCAHELSLLDARLAQLAEEMNFSSPDGLTWKEVDTAFRKCLMVMDDSAAFNPKFEALAELVNRGQNAGSLWAQTGATLELRRKIAETETKRDIALNQTIPKQAVVDVLSNLCHAFRRNVQTYAERELSNKILSKTSRELSRIIATGGLGVIMSGGGSGMAGGDGESGEPVDIEVDDIFS